jgi:hypothetical protein
MNFNSTNSSFLECVVKCDVLTSSINFTGSETEKQQTISVKFQNSVMRFIPDIGQVFPNMRILSIINGTLRDGLKEGFLHKGLAALTELRIERTALPKIEKYAFKELINLEKLTLFNCEIESLPYQYFKAIPNLTEIFLHRNRVSMVNLKLFEGLKSLRMVSDFYGKLVSSTDSDDMAFKLAKEFNHWYRKCLEDNVCMRESTAGSRGSDVTLTMALIEYTEYKTRMVYINLLMFVGGVAVLICIVASVAKPVESCRRVENVQT